MKNFLAYILFISVAFIATECFSQGKDSSDSLTIQKADNIVNGYMADETQHNDHLLFSIADRWYLVIVRGPKKSVAYYFDAQSNIRSRKRIKGDDGLLKAFDEALYQDGYVTFNSPFFKNTEIKSEGNITYFYLMKNHVKFGESRLSVKISPNPIPKEIYDMLSTELLSFMSKYANKI